MFAYIISKIKILQKKAIRIITWFHYIAPWYPLLVKLILLKLVDLYKHQLAGFALGLRHSPYNNFFTVWRNEKCTLSPIWQKMKCGTDKSRISFESNILEISKSNTNIQWLQIRLEYIRLNGIRMSCRDTASSRGHNASIFLFTFWPNHENNILQVTAAKHTLTYLMYIYTH